MASEIEIVSNALILLGDKSVTSFEEASDRALLVKSLYTSTRDAVLRAHPWNFAIRRKVVAKDAAAPVFGEFKTQFTLPTDPYCLRVLDVDDDPEIRFKIEGRKILADVETLNLRYVARIVDTNEYDALFLTTLEARLAADAATPVTGSASMFNQMWAVYTSKLREARSIDGQEGSPDTFSANDLSKVR